MTIKQTYTHDDFSIKKTVLCLCNQIYFTNHVQNEFMLLLFAVPCFASFYSLQMATNWKNILHNDKFTQIYFECRSICDHITRKTLSWLYYISMKRIWPIEYHSEFNRCIEIVLKSNLNQLISHQNIAHNFQNKVPVSETASNFWYY